MNNYINNLKSFLEIILVAVVSFLLFAYVPLLVIGLLFFYFYIRGNYYLLFIFSFIYDLIYNNLEYLIPYVFLTSIFLVLFTILFKKFFKGIFRNKNIGYDF